MKINKLYLIISITLLLVGCKTTSKVHQGSINSISNLKEIVEYLSSDEMNGRANGSEELLEAGNWVAEKFKKARLSPYKDDSYIQLFDNKFDRELINTIGVLKGKTSDRYIVISAHIDHIGTSSKGEDRIFNGADDNATGVAGVITLANMLSDIKKRLQHSFVFVVFSGEERGFLGATHFIKSNIFPLDQIVMNINLEMLGRTEELGEKKFIITGSNESYLNQLVSEYNEDKNWENINYSYSDILYRMADSYAFVREARQNNMEIIAHTFALTGVGGKHLHTVKDEAEFINYENMQSFIDYLYNLIIYLDNNIDPVL